MFGTFCANFMFRRDLMKMTYHFKVRRGLHMCFSRQIVAAIGIFQYFGIAPCVLYLVILHGNPKKLSTNHVYRYILSLFGNKSMFSEKKSQYPAELREMISNPAFMRESRNFRGSPLPVD